MKKILAILTVIFTMSVVTSCVDTYELTAPLTLDNYDLTIPRTASKKGVNGENIHYFHITATGPWEATLTPQPDSGVWCYLKDYYTEPKRDGNGKPIKDENGRVLTESVKVAEGVELIEKTEDHYKVVRGNAGVTYLPMEYIDNQSGHVRYAVLHVRRLDIDYEKFTTITQSK